MNEKFVRGLAIGVALAAGALIFGPSIAQAARPVVRRGMKSAVQAYVRGREAVAELMELAEDAYAEAWADLKEEADAKAETGAAASASVPDLASEAIHEPKRKKR